MQKNIRERFIIGIRWNVTGSILYELAKMLHQVMLFAAVPLATYGIIGSFFSLIYLTITFASLGIEQGILPFMPLLIRHKNNFITFVPLIALIKLLSLSAGGILAMLLCAKTTFLPDIATHYILLLFLILFEGIRQLLRKILHTAFFHKPAVLIDLSLTFLYYAAVWLPFILQGTELTLSRIFAPYLIHSMLAVLLLIYLLYRLYQTLPNDTSDTQQPSWHAMRISCMHNYGIQLTQSLSSGNFLSTFFAIKYGITQAAIIKFASYIATFVNGIIHAIVDLSGGALLVAVKNQSIKAKQKAFHLISQKVTGVVGTLVLLILLHGKQLLFQHFAAPQSALIPAALFLIITCIEHWSLLYTQFYTLEQHAHISLRFSLLEAILLSCVFFFHTPLSPLITLMFVIMVKLCHFALIATDAYYQWHISPAFTRGWRVLAACGFMSLAITLVTNNTIITTTLKQAVKRIAMAITPTSHKSVILRRFT